MKETIPFFKIMTDSECVWETDPSINSDYYYNDINQIMEVHRENILSTGSGGFRGFSLGNGPTLGGDIESIPLSAGNTSIPGMGWFFGEWSGQHSLLQSIEVRNDWTLAKNEGGFFFDRFSFHRIQADRYEWVQPRHGCGSYVKTASGALDIGSRTTEFNSVPLNYSGQPDQVLNFVARQRPTVDTCQTDVNVQARRADYLISSDQDNMMFFYPNQTSTNQ
jgi:hypothetical protein